VGPDAALEDPTPNPKSCNVLIIATHIQKVFSPATSQLALQVKPSASRAWSATRNKNARQFTPLVQC
jgi:hypothetical protein